MALHPRPFISDIAIFVLKGDVKLQLTDCAGLQTERNIDVAVYASYAGFFPHRSAAPHKTCYRHRVFPVSLLRGRRCCRRPVFPCVEFLAASQRQENISGVGLCTLVVAGFF